MSQLHRLCHSCTDYVTAAQIMSQLHRLCHSCTDYVTAVQIFQKHGNTITILGARLVTCNQFQTEDPQVLGVIVNT